MVSEVSGPGWSASSRRWAVLSLLGIAAWIGVTVFVAANLDDPGDGAAVLRAFALGGAVFFGVVFVGAAIGIRRGDRRMSHERYLRLALTPPAPDALRAAQASSRRTAWIYLVLWGVLTAALLATIGLGEEGPWRIVFPAMAVVVVIWAVAAIWLVAGGAAWSPAVVEPLGLTLTETPGWIPRSTGGGVMVGAVRFEGERHGRRVVIVQEPSTAETTIAGSLPTARVTAPSQMSALAGEPVATWRGVEIETGPDGVTVRRTANGAARWMLQDLHLAEQVSASAS